MVSQAFSVPRWSRTRGVSREVCQARIVEHVLRGVAEQEVSDTTEDLGPRARRAPAAPGRQADPDCPTLR